MSTEYPLLTKYDIKLGTSSTTIKSPQPELHPSRDIIAYPQSFKGLQGPGCLNSLNGGNLTNRTKWANGPCGFKLTTTIFL